MLESKQRRHAYDVVVQNELFNLATNLNVPSSLNLSLMLIHVEIKCQITTDPG